MWLLVSLSDGMPQRLGLYLETELAIVTICTLERRPLSHLLVGTKSSFDTTWLAFCIEINYLGGEDFCSTAVWVEME